MRTILLAILLVGMLGSAASFLWLGQDKEKQLRIATIVWPGYEPLYLAQTLGLYRDRTIKLIELRSSSDIMQLLRAGVIEAAALSLDETLTLVQDGFDLAVVLVMDVSAGGDMILAHPQIEDFKQLRHKRIGVENTAVGAILLEGVLTVSGMTPAEIQIVPLSVDEHERAYLSGKVDAVVTFEPVATRLRKQGARLLFDSSRIPGRIVDVLVVRRDLLKGREGALKSLIEGFFKAREYWQSHPQQAAKLMADCLALSPSDVIKSFKGLHLPDLAENHSWLSGQSPPLELKAESLAAFMLKHQLLRNNVVTEHLADPRFLPEGNR